MTSDDPNAVQVAPGLSVPERVLRFSYTGSGGPGGQNVNKLATKAVLTVHLDELTDAIGSTTTRRLKRIAGGRLTGDGRLILTSDEHRSQRDNRRACIEKLGELLRHAARPPRPRKPTRPTRSSKERRLQQKKRRGQIKRLRQQRDL